MASQPAETDLLHSFALADPDAPERAARFLKSLAHRDRLKILCVLLNRELCVADIEEAVGVAQSAVSQHLTRLKIEGIVATRREGRQVFYRVSDPAALAVVDVLYKRFCSGVARRN